VHKNGLAVYNHHFHQIAASRLDTTWARKDNDLWNAIFTRSQRRPYCQHCFGSMHSSEQCCGAPETSTSTDASCLQDLLGMELLSVFFPNCRFVHACLTCYNDTRSWESNLKWIHCHRNPDWHWVLPPMPPSQGWHRKRRGIGIGVLRVWHRCQFPPPQQHPYKVYNSTHQMLNPNIVVLV